MEQVEDQQNYNQEDTQLQNQVDDQDDFDFKDIISKKKEKYRVEIRKKKTNDLLAKTRSKLLQKQIQQNNIVPQQKEFNTYQDKIQYISQLLEQIEFNIKISRTQMNEKVADTIMQFVNFINETITQDENCESEFVEQVNKLRIVNKLLPIIEEDQFKNYIFLLYNTYNLYGTLFYVDDKVVENAVDQRILSSLYQSLKSPEVSIVIQGLFLFGNLISGNKRLKQQVLELGLIEDLFQLHVQDRFNVDNYGDLYFEYINDFIWLFGVYLDNHKGFFKSQILTIDLQIKQGKKIIEIIFDLASKSSIFTSKQIKTARYLAKNIVDAVGGKDDYIDYFFSLQSIKNVNLCDQFLDMLKNCSYYDPFVIQNLSRFIFNIVCGPDIYLEGLMHNNLLDVLQSLYENYSKDKKYQCEIVWAISNICTVSSEFIQSVMDHPFFSILMNSYDQLIFDLKREILYVIIQIFITGKMDQIRQIVESQFMAKYIEATNSTDTKLIVCLLNGIDKLLDKFSQMPRVNGENSILISLEKNNLINVLTELQKHKKEEVYNSVLEIIQKHLQYTD